MRHRHEPYRFVAVRLGLARYLAHGLEFPASQRRAAHRGRPHTLQRIGELAAVAAIGTALNYFLAVEIKEEQEQLAAQHEGPPSPAALT